MAAVTAVVGLAALPHVRHAGEIPVAIVPLLFAVQQAVEGFVWLELTGEGGGANIVPLSFVFLVFAKVLWPVYAPLAVLLIEHDHRRRLAMRIIALLGTVISVYLLVTLINDPPSATIRSHSISYSGDGSLLSWRLLPYVLCTGVPLLMSSHRTIQLFGAVVMVGLLVSSYAYVATYVSVWCFFAAAGSVVLYFSFKHAFIRVSQSPA